MGIQKFMQIVRENAPEAIYTSPLERFKGQKIAVDISIWAQQFSYTLLPSFVSEDEEGELVVDWNGLEKRWLTKILELVLSLIRHEITPIFIFDGRASKLKKDEHQKREKERQRKETLFLTAKEKYLASIGSFSQEDFKESYRKKFLAQVRFNYKLIKNLKEFLVDTGFIVYQSVEEADYLIGALARDGIIKTVFTTDTDLIIYGLPFLLTDFYQETVTVFNNKSSLIKLNLLKKNFLILAILLGTDYNDGIAGVGHKTALKLINEWGSLEMLPSKYDQTSLKRTANRKRFSIIPHWEQLVEGSDMKTEFSVETFREMGYKTFQRFGLQRIYEEFKEEILNK